MNFIRSIRCSHSPTAKPLSFELSHHIEEYVSLYTWMISFNPIGWDSRKSRKLHICGFSSTTITRHCLYLNQLPLTLICLLNHITTLNFKFIKWNSIWSQEFILNILKFRVVINVDYLFRPFTISTMMTRAIKIILTFNLGSRQFSMNWMLN